jgi:NitT/TauT family transport system substrate-binding protein
MPVQRRLSRETFLALSAAFAGTAASVQGQGLTTLHVATSPDEDIVAALYAQQSGIFRRLGLNVIVTPAPSGSAVASAIIGGALEIGKSSLIGLITAHSRGVPFTLVAAASEWNGDAPTNGTLVRSDSQLRTARDLAGKTVAVPALRGQLQVATMAWVDQNGGDSSTVRFVELPAAANIGALDTGRIDAATFVNPNFAEALATKRTRLFASVSSSIAKHYLAAGYFCTVDWATKNADIVRTFARGIVESSRYCNDHHAETVGLIAGFTKIDPQVIARMERVTIGVSLDPVEIQPQIDVAVKYKTIPTRFDAREIIFQT